MHLEEATDIILQVSDGRFWGARCGFYLGKRMRKRAELIGGWRKFRLDNNLKVGDFCVFEMISKSSRRICFKVEIFRASWSTKSTSKRTILEVDYILGVFDKQGNVFVILVRYCFIFTCILIYVELLVSIYMFFFHCFGNWKCKIVWFLSSNVLIISLMEVLKLCFWKIYILKLLIKWLWKPKHPSFLKLYNLWMKVVFYIQLS